MKTNESNESKIQKTLEYCLKQTNNDEVKAKQFALNIIRKHHPELLLDAYNTLKSSNDIKIEILQALKWGIETILKSENYELNFIKLAHRALEKRRVTEDERFTDILLSILLHDYVN